MIESTKDILFISISFAVILLALVTAWAIYYVAMILRQFRKITTDVRLKIEAVDRAIQKVGERMADAGAVGKLIVDSAKVAVDAYRVRNEAHGNKKKK
jgi:hypothetical protein